MDPFAKWHWATKLIAGLGLLASGVLWLSDNPNETDTVRVENRFAAAFASIETVAPRDRRTTLQNVKPLSPLTHFSAMVERPLFDPGRRTVAAIDNAVDALAEGLGYPLIWFIGTMVDHNGIRALTSGPHGSRSVSVGEEIDGWDIVAIEARRLVLSRGTKQIEYTILAQSSQKSRATLGQKEQRI